jgi:Kef-type K+ transport system membrane component KefB
VDATIADVIGDIAVVFIVASLLGSLASRIGQPAVIGQILTGVVLGPSVLGHVPGHLASHLFPGRVLPYLNVLSQVAIAIFMFAVGYEIELGTLRRCGRVVSLVAVGAFFVPMALGMGCVLLLRPEFNAIGIAHQGRSFVLFMGAATSITALPVLASIVRDRDLAGTTAGVVATAAAGLMDVLAWLVLAAALVGAGHSAPFPLSVTVVLLLGFVLVMLAVVRPAVSWWTSRRQSVLSTAVAVAFALAVAGAWVTAALGLHPIFGAFLAGLVMRGGSRAPDADVVRAMEQAGGMLLPLFFVVTGLSLNIGGVRGDALVLFVIVLAISTAGKLGPGYAMSRLCGLSRLDSGTIAALVNTRGLTELIALNAGLADGIINVRLFTILVIMAVVTTIATGPLLSALKPERTRLPIAGETRV